MYTKKIATTLLGAFALLALAAPVVQAQDESDRGRAPWMTRRAQQDGQEQASGNQFAQRGSNQASEQDGERAQRRPPNFDTNGDGSVDLDEFKKAAPPHASRSGEDSETFFKKIDANGDGKISQDEFKASAPPHRGRPPQGQRPQGQRPQGGEQGRQARQ
jgi:hypothetical protein